jgi:hypothetical protein
VPSTDHSLNGGDKEEIPFNQKELLIHAKAAFETKVNKFSDVIL